MPDNLNHAHIIESRPRLEPGPQVATGRAQNLHRLADGLSGAESVARAQRVNRQSRTVPRAR
jgi:hypothetical protein